MASITWKAYEEILFQHSTYVAYMVVDYLTCKELTALQSCRKKKGRQNPDKTPDRLHQKSR